MIEVRSMRAAGKATMQRLIQISGVKAIYMIHPIALATVLSEVIQT